ncbi:uncharacterized protein LOC125054063 [Pieris napi]|uniref:uncharacterized protein LOC125054063 n=1 Tax=Pieris napi TaxID=78633 RepID=UPI001FB89796|nr:uncharacterized protein LOC125054063 [Pieris napi]
MDLFNRIGHLIIILIFANISQCLRVKDEFFKRNKEMCMRVAKQPFFDVDLVVGKPWKVFHTWNLKLDGDITCFEFTFKNASGETINRVWSEMGEYLEQQPSWEAATLSLYVGPSKHEMLLFADQGPAGSFVGVPNMVRSSSLVPTRKGVSLIKFQFKLLNEGKYLLIVDCNQGVASLGTRSQEPANKSEIEGLVAGLNLGDGFPVCAKESNKNEELL